jgi:hypothetical protein
MNDNDFETVEVQEIPNATNGLQIYQQDKALIDIQIATAKQYPRNLQRAIQNAITVVTMDMEAAESCTYSLKKGGKTITGPSVHLAKIVAQQLGNIRIENRVVGYDATHVTCEAVCFDLERNFAMRTQIKRSIVGSSGRYSEDMCVIVGNAGNSVALRNAVFAVVDAAIVRKIYNAAKNKITGDVSDENKLLSRRNLLINGFKNIYSSFKLTDEEIAGAVGKKVVEHITADDLVVLIGFEKSLQAGELTFETIFRPNIVGKPVARPVVADKSAERIFQLIGNAKDLKALEKLSKDCTTNEARLAYDDKFKTLK